MARVSNLPCPVYLDKKNPIVHVHKSNGIFVAIDGDTVYMTCTECSFESDQEKKGCNLELVQGTQGRRYSWAILTEQVYKTLVASPPVTGEFHVLRLRTPCFVYSVAQAGVCETN